MTEVVWSPLEPASLWQTAALVPQPLSAPADPGSDSDSTAAILARGTVSVREVIVQALLSISIAATPPAATLLCWALALRMHCSRSAAPAPAQAAVAEATSPVPAEARRPTNGNALDSHIETFGDRRCAGQRCGVEGRLSRRRRASPPLALCRRASCQDLPHCGCALSLQVVIIRGNARTKASLIGQRAVVRRAVGLGGWHWLQVRRAEELSARPEMPNRRAGLPVQRSAFAAVRNPA